MNNTLFRKQLAFIILVFLIGLFVVPGITDSAVSERSGGRGWVYVDDDAPPEWYDETHVRTIQEGINNASIGDTVYVYNGFYQEHVVVNKRVGLIGENRDLTIIDGAGSGDVARITVNWVNISGFRVQNSGNYWSHTNPDAGIEVRADHVIISDNNLIDNNRYGVYVRNSAQVTVSNNYVHNNFDDGIYLHYSHGNVVSDNFVNANLDDGISIKESTNNHATNNTITNHTTETGFVISDSASHNIISKNNVLNNGRGFTMRSGSNEIFHNNIINNAESANDSSTNSWYNATLKEGNYWSDYNGTDIDCDGIGDTPYDVPGGSNQDLYPFMEQDGWLQIETPIYNINPIKDTHIRHVYPDLNFGHYDEVVVRNEYGAGGSPGYGIDTLIEFDLSELPPDASIINATLTLYYLRWSENDPGGRTLTLHRITSEWDEHTVTWNTRPTYDNEISTSADVPLDTGLWMSLDVTSDVQNFIDGIAINYGWQLMDENYWGSGNIPVVYFPSKEGYNNIPYLEIEVETESLPPTANFNYTPPNPERMELIQFTDLSTDPNGMIVSWYWDFDDEYYSSVQNPVHCYCNDGIYNVSLTVTDDDGETDTITKTIIVYTPDNNPPGTPARPSGPQRGRTDRTYIYTTKTTDPNGDLLWYKWDWGDDTFSDWLGPYGSGLIAGASHTWSSAGSYQIKVKARDIHGAESSWSQPLTVRIFGIDVQPVVHSLSMPPIDM